MIAQKLEFLQRVSRRAWIFVAIVTTIVVFDQVTKWQAVEHLTQAFEVAGSQELSFGEKLSLFLWQRHPVRTEPVAILDNFWHFRYVENPGAAWGFLSWAPAWFRSPFFLLVSVAAMVFIIYYFRRTKPEQWLLGVALALVFGGAVGNFLDRVRLGYVIDFIDWHWYQKATWPTFNIADSAITVGVSIMILEMWLSRPSKVREEAGSAQQAP